MEVSNDQASIHKTRVDSLLYRIQVRSDRAEEKPLTTAVAGRWHAARGNGRALRGWRVKVK